MTASPLPPLQSPQRRRWRRLVARTALIALMSVIVLAAWKSLIWPDVAALRAQDPQTTAFIDRHRRARRAKDLPDDVTWSPVPLRRISRDLQLAVLVAEDDRFFAHEGFATEEIM